MSFSFLFLAQGLQARQIHPFELLDNLNIAMWTLVTGRDLAKEVHSFSIEFGDDRNVRTMPTNEVDTKEEQSGKNKVSFEDIAGIDHVVAQVREVVDYIKNRKKYEELGAKVPTGILLEGLPGVGKTLLARALANEAGVPFFYKAGSEFVELYVGQGASRVREIFNQAREAARKAGGAVIFIDEIDALGAARDGAGNREYDQTLNQMLTEMDGFRKDENIVVIAATNRADMLDPALTRPGRFTTIISISLPDKKARTDILSLYIHKLPKVSKLILDNGEGKRIATRSIPKKTFLEELVEKTIGFSGAELADVVNCAALHACRENAERVEKKHFDHALQDALGAKQVRSSQNKKWPRF